ncbi:carboxy terminal-processing peptidase [Aureispira anguillae]|uniref:Carboxy terminal-processing peptidase n=1 Tax=Aureispira anguillae TaxID=2864201 RepID=A0A915VK39_9BACT|nr:carboxy terminal-processing peptidase [Aureispira anguillae]BDS09493.1 carboxy terminal-processing peptidase [Aureispira anguillae]
MMFNKKYFLFLALACSAVFAFTTADTDPDYPNKESLLVDVVLQSLQYNHYKPTKVDDVLSERAYDIYLKRVDNGKRFFLQEDIERFEVHRKKLDDYAMKKDFAFFDDLHKIRNERIKQAQTFYKEILSKPFDFEKKETMETDDDKMAYAKTEKELYTRWHKLLKHRVLLDMQVKLKRQEKAKKKKDESVEIKTIEELEKDSRAKILKQFDRWSKDIDQEDRDDKIAAYINTIANVLEPHTSYFPPLEKQNFNIRISGKLEGIGAQLRQEDGYIKVVRIVPGSASWRQGDLGVNDLIIKVAQGKEEPVDVVDMKMDDVLPLIRGQKGTEVRLTVKKTDGTIKTIPIVRDVVVLEESYAKSAVLEYKKNKKKVGLIDLRSFYADFKDPRGRRCSRDVKREVQKLIAEGIDGIVIDLRFNGGGSLRDVVDMSGLFIETGPIVQVKGRDSRPHPLEDRDPSVLYDGPLVIMVNSFSASASEIMAAALQDYGRAIVVGTSPSTFGKGTVQRFFDLDAVVPQRYKELGELGSMKITIQKFFRINGGSTQLKGVVPDIILPGVYSYREIGEKEEDFPMAWTEIDPVYYKKSTIKKLDKIKKKSEKRVATNEAFAMIDERAKWFKALQEDTEISLNMKEYRAQQEEYNKISEKYKDINKEIPHLAVDILAADIATLEADTIRKESIQKWHKSLKKDPYIEEVVQIIGDWN